MEELIGVQWHHLVSRRANRRHPEARVTLDEVRLAVGILFRAMGGPGGLTLKAVAEQRHQARRGWWQRIAGTGLTTPWCWRDGQALHMPETIDLFPERSLNRELYLWLAALAALGDGADDDSGWFVDNQARVRRLLADFPGLLTRYRRLCAAHLAERPNPEELTGPEQLAEQAIRIALTDPGSVAALPDAPPPWPVPLWSHPDPPMTANSSVLPDDQDPQPEERAAQQGREADNKKRRAEQVAPLRTEGGLALHRFESIFSWADFIRVDRPTDEETDWVNDELRVIDVIRDALFLFGEALSASRDRFGLFGFSSRRREHVRFHEIKRFDAPYDGQTRGRIQALKPGYYTRMGAAIRHATALLSQQPAQQRLLLLLTDGKPNDIDRYEGRYGVEDTRNAVKEAKNRGVRPFCVTIDREAERYVVHLFGPGGFSHIRRASDLPRKLPELYAQLTR